MEMCEFSREERRESSLYFTYSSDFRAIVYFRDKNTKKPPFQAVYSVN